MTREEKMVKIIQMLSELNEENLKKASSFAIELAEEQEQAKAKQNNQKEA